MSPDDPSICACPPVSKAGDEGRGRFALSLGGSVLLHGLFLAGFLLVLSAGLWRGAGEAFTETTAIDVILVPDVVPVPAARAEEAVRSAPEAPLEQAALEKELVSAEPPAPVAVSTSSVPPAKPQKAAPPVTPTDVVMMPPRNARAGIVAYNYHQQLLAHIERHKYYPAIARRRALEGTAIIAFDLDVKGGLRSYSLVRSAGHKILDEAALTAIRNASPFPPPPANQIERRAFAFQVPVRFSLK